MTGIVHDAVIVGSGAAGSFAAEDLTDQGLSVLLLEAGPEIGPQHFDPSRKPKKPRPIHIAERAAATLGGQPVQSRAAFFRGVLSHLYVNDRDNPYTTPRDAPFVWIRGRQAGGRTHTFGRVLLRWTDDNFKSKTRTGRGVDWPISYEELAPFYDEVESYLGLYGNADGVESLPDGVTKAPAKLTPAERHFKASVEDRWPERHVIAWRSVAPEPSRVMRPLRAAKESGRLTIRYDTFARRVLTEGRRATGVEVVDRISGATSVVRADRVILCASPIESVRLLLNSASADHPGGLGNSSGQLGRYFMDQLPMLAMGIYPPVTGHAGDHSQPPDPFYDAQGGIFVPRFDAQDDPSQLLFFGFGQMQPHAENRITLDPRKTDRWGIPVPHIACRMRPEDEALLVRQEEAFLDTVNGAGGKVEFLGSPRGIREWGRGAYPEADPLSRFLFRRFFGRVMVMGAAIHETGGARMGDDPAASVLNRWGQCWNAPNLYVTDASAFAGSGVSGTTLSVMAQTVRACRHLALRRTQAGAGEALVAAMTGRAGSQGG
ncbi:Glucose-methanol-choline (GMC) oxidoreductase:NAD binding protein site [Rubellimicrobium mesophilum DSM 19309]|uniref:Glucose-methanol-choline (GMC) oxidoreductase:NAD binding protein site n=1 Tax=Rubellimicrobium mesophilum DSM 19309 TaxID=442562 RepID=A0A017HKH1_9RHOB|nr:GMC family oxidoreductase [Rubellimicrobium mesophilum]EYD74274.1 Glucose-methanol-choline (GMC) oxidoreductase:NAD binding protein site [Rubellimicrobium mesophilum DSM 19309]